MDAAYHHLPALQRELANAGVAFAPCLSAADLAAFEQTHRVALPLEYRLYLAHIGNGGTGPPDYGLRALGATETWWTNAQRAAWGNFQAIRRPFPFTQPWCWENDETPDQAQLAAVYDGSLYLGTDGCGLDWALIVTGPQRGYVWQLSGEGIMPCRPALTFFQWVSAWLHRSPDSPVPFWWIL